MQKILARALIYKTYKKLLIFKLFKVTFKNYKRVIFKFKRETKLIKLT